MWNKRLHAKRTQTASLPVRFKNPKEPAYLLFSTHAPWAQASHLQMADLNYSLNNWTGINDNSDLCKVHLKRAPAKINNNRSYVMFYENIKRKYHVIMFTMATNVISLTQDTMALASWLCFDFMQLFFLTFEYSNGVKRMKGIGISVVVSDIVHSKSATAWTGCPSVRMSAEASTSCNADHNTWCRGNLEEQCTVLSNTLWFWKFQCWMWRESGFPLLLWKKLLP